MRNNLFLEEHYQLCDTFFREADPDSTFGIVAF